MKIMKTLLLLCILPLAAIAADTNLVRIELNWSFGSESLNIKVENIPASQATNVTSIIMTNFASIRAIKERDYNRYR